MAKAIEVSKVMEVSQVMEVAGEVGGVAVGKGATAQVVVRGAVGSRSNSRRTGTRGEWLRRRSTQR